MEKVLLTSKQNLKNKSRNIFSDILAGGINSTLLYTHQSQTKTRKVMKTITRASVMNFWVRDIIRNNADYIDDCNEFNTTTMGEMAAEHFGVMSDDGNSPIEQDIFDWAVEFSQNHVVSEFK